MLSRGPSLDIIYASKPRVMCEQNAGLVDFRSSLVTVLCILQSTFTYSARGATTPPRLRFRKVSPVSQTLQYFHSYISPSPCFHQDSESTSRAPSWRQAPNQVRVSYQLHIVTRLTITGGVKRKHRQLNSHENGEFLVCFVRRTGKYAS